MEFVELISAARSYLTRFDETHYPACFQAFAADCAPLFAAVEDMDPEAAAAGLIDALEKGRAQLPRRAKKRAFEEERRVLALFLAPAASLRGGAAMAFADTLCRQWNDRYPKSPFFTGTYEAIMKGFAPTTMGIPVQSFRS